LFDSKIFWFASFLGLSFASSNDQGVVLWIRFIKDGVSYLCFYYQLKFISLGALFALLLAVNGKLGRSPIYRCSTMFFMTILRVVICRHCLDRWTTDWYWKIRIPFKSDLFREQHKRASVAWLASRIWSTVLDILVTSIWNIRSFMSAFSVSSFRCFSVFAR
jgi:hypothetical protein